jgi:hypothetical protein
MVEESINITLETAYNGLNRLENASKACSLMQPSKACPLQEGVGKVVILCVI